MIRKPICFSYSKYIEMREAYEQLLADNQKLSADNRKLRERVSNLEIRCRIEEERNG